MKSLNDLFQKLEHYIRIELLIITFGILLLGAFIIVMGAIYLQNATEAIIINVGTEIMGIGLTYFLVQIYIDTQAEKNRINIQEIAFFKIKDSTNKLLLSFFEIYKSSQESNVKFDSQNHKPKVSINWLFSIEYINQLNYFDASKKYGSTKVTWQEHLKEITNITALFGTVLDRYAVYFNRNQIDLLEMYEKNEFYQHLQNCQNTDKIKFSDSDVKLEFQNYLSIIFQIYKEFDKISENILQKFDDSLWSNDIEPKFGSARI